MDLYIVTGGSKGLGLSLSQSLARKNAKVLSLSRTRGPSDGLDIDYIRVDFSVPQDYTALLQNINFNQYDSLTLINNAAIVTPIAPVERLSSKEILKAMTINLYAPIALTSAWIKLSDDFSGKRTILNITSGVAIRPKGNWSVYSASKAGLEAFAESLKKEKIYELNFRVYNFDPGLMDTNMQRNIRDTDPNDFPELQRFINFKKNGDLEKTSVVAESIINLLSSNQTDEQIRFSVKEF